MASSPYLKILDEGMMTLLYNRFATVLGLTSITTDIALMPERIAFRQIAESRGDSTVGFISFYRSNTSFGVERMHTPYARREIYLDYTNGDHTDFISVKAVPINLTYDILFWHRDLESIMKAVESFFFWKYENPNLYLDFESKGNLEYDMNFGKDIVDKSTTENMYNIGNYFVHGASITLDGWAFKIGSTKTIKKIMLALYQSVADGSPILLSEKTITCS